MQSRICMPFLKIDLTSNSLWRKRVQMQPMRLCICSGTQFEETIKKRVQMQQMRLCVYSGRPFKKTSENYLRWKIVQMQSMRLCICLGRQFEKTFENTLWRKGVQMLPMWFCICSGRKFEETKPTNATNATLHIFKAFSENIWKLPRSNAINATLHLDSQGIWRHIWKLTFKKKSTNATNVPLHQKFTH